MEKGDDANARLQPVVLVGAQMAAAGERPIQVMTRMLVAEQRMDEQVTQVGAGQVNVEGQTRGARRQAKEMEHNQPKDHAQGAEGQAGGHEAQRHERQMNEGQMNERRMNEGQMNEGRMNEVQMKEA